MGLIRFVFVVIVFATVAGYAQHYPHSQYNMNASRPIVCYGKAADEPGFVPAPRQYQAWQNGANARAKTATFQVTYVGFTAEAKAAFQKAVDIWSTLITSPVTIHVQAVWKPLGTGVLGSAIWGSVHANFDGAQRINTLYPVALAEKMAGADLNAPGDIDIYAEFSSTFNWYTGLTGTPPSGTYDLVTVVLHELGHGLGFVDSYFASNGIGYVGTTEAMLPMIYDQYMENTSGQNLYKTFDSGSAALGSQITSNAIFFNSPTVVSNNDNTRAAIYAPNPYNSGSSISHLDEATYPGGSVNALMTPQVARLEVDHDPGPIVLNAFSDMGWVFTYLKHNDLKDTENLTGPYVVKVKVTSESGPATQPKLHYTTGGAETTVAMTPTGNASEYQASIPATGAQTTYAYYISVTDGLNRGYTRPGKLYSPHQEPQQTYTMFKTGPDTEKPVIAHTPKAFVVTADATLNLAATVTDNLGIDAVKVEYLINDVAKPDLVMAAGANDVFTAAINLTTLNNGDKIKYRIVATDAAASPNTAVNPEAGYHEVNVVSLEPTRDAYATTFDDAAGFFFGNNWSIVTYSGFSNPALHSVHPYIKGDGSPGNELNFIYQLRIPIRVQAQDAYVKFDEVVLVEPGASGSEFGSDDFYDYAVVEGSKDGGITWTPLADGYDSRDNADWLTAYNAATDSDGNSVTAGAPSLFRPRVLNLLDQFDAGDEVVIRFRLFSDQLSIGWGWAVDNLRIQIDETAPVVLHNHVDYKLHTDTELPLTTRVSDFGGIQDVKIEFQLNDQAIETSEFPVTPGNEEFTLNLDIDALNAGDVIQYRIVAHDNNSNETVLPAEGMFKVVIFAPGTPQGDYASDFNSGNTDFIGNFFGIAKPNGFADNAIHSSHNYLNGFGLDNTSSYTYMLSKPIHLSADIPYMKFREVAVVETHAASAVFGTPAFKDYVIAEGSKDGGVTWLPFMDGYSANDQADWTAKWNQQAAGTQAQFKIRTINLLASGNFSAGDDVLFRFRMYANSTLSGWGWAIDDLYIQSPVLATELSAYSGLRVYPNPARSEVNISMESTGAGEVVLTLVNAQGQPVLSEHVVPHGPAWSTTLDLAAISNGLYMLKIEGPDGQIVKKIVKTGY